MSASYTKLRDGSWGLRIQGSAQKGQSVIVTKKSGETKTEIVGKILWSMENGITLVAIAQSGNSHSRSSDGRRRAGSCGCDCEECSERCMCDRSCNCRGGVIFMTANTPRLVKASESQSAAIQQPQKVPQVRFTNWATQFKIEQANRPSPQMQFRNLFKEEVAN